MSNTPIQEIAINLLINTEITKADIETKFLETGFGIRLIEKERTRFDRREKFCENGLTWVLENQELGWGAKGFDEICNKHRWDISTDSTMACFRSNFVEFIYFDIAYLSKEIQDELCNLKSIEEEEAEKRNKVKDLLSNVLVYSMYPYGKLSSGELETKYGVHLKEIQRGMHMNVKYKPRYGNIGWVSNQVLGWGASTGWDITLDGKIACCRVNYDDYINFEIEILSESEIEDYKAKFSKSDNMLIDRLTTLKSMFDKGLISTEEFDDKKKEILEAV